MGWFSETLWAERIDDRFLAVVWRDSKDFGLLTVEDRLNPLLGGVGDLLSERVPVHLGPDGLPSPTDAAAFRARAIEAIEAALGPGPHPPPQSEAPPAERTPPEPLSEETRTTLPLVLWLLALGLLHFLRFA